MNVRRYVQSNPFLILALVALIIGELGSMPAGFDYDPNPVRQFLRLVFQIIGFPFMLVGALLLDGLRDDPRLLIPLNIGLGLVPYLLADWLLQRRRARRSKVERPLSASH